MNLFHFIFRRVYIRFDYLCLIFETLNIKITTLMLQKTFLARCDNRACLAKTNIMSGSPEAWLSNDILSKSNTFGLTFDFFVDWAINQISPYVWIKRILLPNYTYDEFIGKLDFVQSPNQKIPDRKTKCVIKTHINIKQNVIFGAKLKPV